jgi:hypothetical protein
MNSFAAMQSMRMINSGHDTESAALRIAYTKINESDDPEKNATPNENSEYIFCSERLARLLAMMISRSKSSTASTSR